MIKTPPRQHSMPENMSAQGCTALSVWGTSDIIYIRHSHWLDYNFSHVNTNTMAAADTHCAATSDGAMCSAVVNDMRNDVPLSLGTRNETLQLCAA